MNTQKISKNAIKKAYYSNADLVVGKDLDGRYIFRSDGEANLIRKVREMKLNGLNLVSIQKNMS